jgi:lysylphosphatidylglycerol synthetase-like protein (DUF2156 family)
MQKGKPEQIHEGLWKSQEDEPMNMTTEQLCVRARRYERKGVWERRLMLGLAPPLTAFVLYELYGLFRLGKFLLVTTETWLLVTSLFMVWGFLRNGPRRTVPAEPCAQFLKREFELKSQFARAARIWILSLLPAVFAAWWAGGPALRAQQMGNKIPWLAKLHAPVPLIVTVSVLALVWLACGSEARRAQREIEKLGGK